MTVVSQEEWHTEEVESLPTHPEQAAQVPPCQVTLTCSFAGPPGILSHSRVLLRIKPVVKKMLPNVCLRPFSLSKPVVRT